MKIEVLVDCPEKLSSITSNDVLNSSIPSKNTSCNYFYKYWLTDGQAVVKKKSFTNIS